MTKVYNKPYRDAIRTALPHAAIVCDRFHIERMVADAVDALRRAIQNGAPQVPRNFDSFRRRVLLACG